MRIMQLVEASFAGVGRHVLDLSVELLAQGHDVEVVYWQDRAEASFLDRVSELPKSVALPPGSTGKGLLKAARAIDAHIASSEPFDILHGHASFGGATARLLPRRRGARLIYTPNALITQAPQIDKKQRLLFTKAERMLARRTDGIIHVSEEERAHASEIGLTPGCSTVVCNGIPLSPLPTRETARAALGLSADATVVGFVGRLVAQKGVDLLIEATDLLARDGHDFIVAIIGSGELESELRAQADQLGVTERIVWLGHQPGALSMPAFDVFALPSRYEGFPYVAIEALWAGVPTVATEECCASALLGDGTAGTIVPRSATAFAEALGHALRPDVNATMRAAAPDIAGNYTAANMARQTAEFYAEVLRS